MHPRFPTLFCIDQASEKCSRGLEKHTILDLAKLGYKRALEEGVGVVPTLKARSDTNNEKSVSELETGWALRPTKKSYRFNENQKSYLISKFNIGQTTGRKADPNLVARDMRRARDSSGERLFNSAEFLSAQQISSFFSRLAAAVRQQTAQEADIEAMEEEINFSAVRDEVISTISLQHPIIYDQYNLCTMADEDALKKLKLGMLQLICEDLNLDTPQPPIRRKAPYLALLMEVIGKCSCKN